jgi:hypothetical protein
MTHYGAKIRNIVTGILEDIAEVTVNDHNESADIVVTLKSGGQKIQHNIRYGMGYSATARQWAQSIFTTHAPPESERK